MLDTYLKWIICFLWASAAFAVIPFVIAAERAILRLCDKYERTVAGYKGQLFVFSGFLIASIWCFRYAVGLCGIYYSLGSEMLTPFEEFFSSFVYSLKIFGVDDGFSEYINMVKEMMSSLFGEGHGLVGFYAGYASVMNAVAPVAGGAIIFEIIASIFPNILVTLSRVAVWREKYYFSELNENTLALIKSINDEYKKKLVRPIIIITDSYIDDESETSVELVNKAKILGALCVKNDIVHVQKNFFGKRKFFLIDMDEKSNIQKLIELTEKLGAHYAKNSEFYPFVSSDIYTSISKKVHKNLGVGDKGDPPVVIPINGYRNIVLNLLSDLPLFEPIVHQYAEDRKANKTTELNVTILGMGQIGTEMFLGTYWCGQMLGCKLNITVISKETGDEFKKRIDYLNPEIFRSADADDPILRIYREDRFAPSGAPKQSEPYFSCKYIQADVKSKGFVDDLDKNTDISNTNYFFVALGSDNENIMMANKMREIIGHSHMMNDGNRRTVIAYVVFDSELCNALNVKKLYSYSGKNNDIYMRALGSIEELYCVSNVFLSEFTGDAQKAHEKYYSSVASEKRKKMAKSISKDMYSYYSSIARRVHRKYKVFSSGIWKESVFNCEEDEYRQKSKEYWDIYVDKMKRLAAEGDRRVLHDLAWLEHRRWNAYLRSCGFRGPQMLLGEEKKQFDPQKTDEYMKKFLNIYGSQKQLELKRHLCLVECDKFGIKATMNTAGGFSDFEVWEIDGDKRYMTMHPDMLDEVMINFAELIGLPKEKEDPEHNRPEDRYDYKQYDYPADEF